LLGKKIKLQGKLSLRGGWLSKGRTEVPQSYDHRSNPCNFNLWTTRRVPSQNWQIIFQT